MLFQIKVTVDDVDIANNIGDENRFIQYLTRTIGFELYKAEIRIKTSLTPVSVRAYFENYFSVIEKIIGSLYPSFKRYFNALYDEYGYDKEKASKKTYDTFEKIMNHLFKVYHSLYEIEHNLYLVKNAKIIVSSKEPEAPPRPAIFAPRPIIIAPEVPAPPMEVPTTSKVKIMDPRAEFEKIKEKEMSRVYTPEKITKMKLEEVAKMSPKKSPSSRKNK